MYVPAPTRSYYSFAGFLTCLFPNQRSIVSSSVPIQGGVQPNSLPGSTHKREHALPANSSHQCSLLTHFAHGLCSTHREPSYLGCPAVPCQLWRLRHPHHCRLSPPDLSVGGPLAAAPCCIASFSGAFCFLSATCKQVGKHELNRCQSRHIGTLMLCLALLCSGPYACGLTR